MTPKIKVEMYTKTVCPYCVKAKTLLQSKGLDVIEYNIETNSQYRADLLKRVLGAKMVPQIFINDELIEGGYDGLYNLDVIGDLDLLLDQQ